MLAAMRAVPCCVAPLTGERHWPPVSEMTVSSQSAQWDSDTRRAIYHNVTVSWSSDALSTAPRSSVFSRCALLRRRSSLFRCVFPSTITASLLRRPQACCAAQCEPPSSSLIRVLLLVVSCLSMSSVDLTGFGRRLLAELRVRRSLNDTLFRHLCRSLLPAAVQARHHADEPILDVADDKDAADGRLLELYTGMLLRCQGHTVTSVGGAKNDGGVDVMVQAAAPGSGSALANESGSVLVQCKQYRDTPVNVDVLVQLLGALDIHDVRHGLLVTSSEVTEGVSKLERQLDRRHKRWQSGGHCTSCGKSQRPLRVQVWDRNRLIALLDQHEAAFVQLRDHSIQQLISDKQLMRTVRQRRGPDYCVRHAICDPHTFPHNECTFGCRPLDQPLHTAASAPPTARKGRGGIRTVRKRHGLHIVQQRDRADRSSQSPLIVTPAREAMTAEIESIHSPQLCTPPRPIHNISASQPCSTHLSSPSSPTLHTQQYTPPSSVAEASELVERLSMSDEVMRPIERSEAEQSEGADHKTVWLPLWETAEVDDTDEDGCESGDDFYDTPDELDSGRDTDAAGADDDGHSMATPIGDKVGLQTLPYMAVTPPRPVFHTHAIASAEQRCTGDVTISGDQHGDRLTTDADATRALNMPSAVCVGETGEMYAAGCDEDDGTPLETLSDDEGTHTQSMAEAESVSSHSNLPTPKTPTSAVRSPARTNPSAFQRLDRMPHRGRRPLATRSVVSCAVMTGEQERRIAQRINDERDMAMDEIDSMLQLILTRPAPHHHIRLPATHTATPNTRPQPPERRRSVSEKRSEAVPDEVDNDHVEREVQLVVTTASDEQEDEEEMDGLSSEEEADADLCSPPRPTLPPPKSPLTRQPTSPPKPIHPTAKHISPSRGHSRHQPTLVRPKRTPGAPRPSPTRSSRADNVPYTDREVRELILLYRKYGGDARRFVNILGDPSCHWLNTDRPGGRNNISLKDKWRNLTALSYTRCDVLSAVCSRIEREARLQRLEKGVMEGKLATKRRADISAVS